MPPRLTVIAVLLLFSFIFPFEAPPPDATKCALSCSRCVWQWQPSSKDLHCCQISHYRCIVSLFFSLFLQNALGDVHLTLHALLLLFKWSRLVFASWFANTNTGRTGLCLGDALLVKQTRAAEDHGWLHTPPAALAGPPSCKQPAMKTLLLDVEFATAEPLFSQLARPAAAHSWSATPVWRRHRVETVDWRQLGWSNRRKFPWRPVPLCEKQL